MQGNPNVTKRANFFLLLLLFGVYTVKAHGARTQNGSGRKEQEKENGGTPTNSRVRDKIEGDLNKQWV